MQIVLSTRGEESPFAPAPADRRSQRAGDRAYSGDYYGAFSIEKFCSAGALSDTHEDAQGWLAYPTKFNPANFWFKDGGVQPWAYYEDYDNWQDTYGIDAVNAVYHSGHGAMDGAGRFYAPVGANWGGLGCTVTSDRMRLGNEQVNYVFWSTCLSLRVLAGHDPIRSWRAANLGFRMLFGFETVSVDDPNYGKFFWEEWQKGQSFSSAWLNASWRISQHQAPSVVACGANQAEATQRLNTERKFEWQHVLSNWWQWRWYYARSAREAAVVLPPELLVAQLEPVTLDERAVRGVLERVGLDVRVPGEIATTRDGGFTLGNGEAQIAFGADGSFAAQLAEPNRDNRDALPQARATSLAQESVRRYGLDQEAELVLDSVREAWDAGGSDEGSGRREGPFVTETTIQFRQVINQLPVLNPGAGTVRVSLDNDGAVTRIESSTRAIRALSDRPRTTMAAPPAPGEPETNGTNGRQGRFAQPRATDAAGYHRLLAAEWANRIALGAVRGQAPQGFSAVPGSTEVGYEIRGDEAALVAQREIEVDFGQGDFGETYQKRYRITADILA